MPASLGASRPNTALIQTPAMRAMRHEYWLKSGCLVLQCARPACARTGHHSCHYRPLIKLLSACRLVGRVGCLSA
eukprot:1933111-Heterocapsa_arctica.AAC.1